MPNAVESILVVEDDQEINALVGAYVELCGFKYRLAFTGAQAFREMQGEIPALVILDLMLPDTEGFEICTRIKADPRTTAVPVILLTALSGEPNRQRGLRCGASEYMNKPFDPDLLMKMIAQYARHQPAAK
jgi:DNA-binding response OmpR family regulator